MSPPDCGGARAFSFTSAPLALNGPTLGTVPGRDFAAAYFSIWFGEKPMDASLKQKLLGG